VPQDTVLFNDTIYYNIQYGQPEASREQVLAAAARRNWRDSSNNCPMATKRASANAA
jgi:ABC-type transport system involved in Fe-S cluster assembly fused permease/ATPase subunit